MVTGFIISLILSGALGWAAARWFSQTAIRTLVRKKEAIAHQLGYLAAQHLPLHILQEKLSEAQLLDSAMPTIEKHIDIFLDVKLKEEIPMIGMFIGNKTTDKLKAVFIKQLQNLFPEIMQQFSGQLFSSLDVQELVRRKISALPDADFKAMLRQPLQQPFTLLQWGGCLTGVLIGMLNCFIFYFL